jgi:hypothetical protein
MLRGEFPGPAPAGGDLAGIIGCILFSMVTSQQPSLQQHLFWMQRLAARASRCCAASTRGCMVAANQLGVSVIMGPAVGLPQLQAVLPSYLSLSAARAGGAQLALTGQRLMGQRALVRYGTRMKLLSLNSLAASSSLSDDKCDSNSSSSNSSSSSSSSSLSAQLPTEMFDGGEGILWVSAKTRHRFQSDSLPVLVLHADTAVVQALHNM